MRDWIYCYSRNARDAWNSGSTDKEGMGPDLKRIEWITERGKECALIAKTCLFQRIFASLGTFVLTATFNWN